MKILPARGALVALLAVLVLAALGIGAASFSWYPEPLVVPPRVIHSAAGHGPLLAGVARVGFHLPEGAPIAGYARWSYASEGVRDPVGARALILAAPGCKVAIASADLVLVPGPLEEAVLRRVEDLGIDGLVVAATHTHAGPGGFWRHRVAERAGTGPYDPKLRDVIADAIAEALRQANAELEPATVAVARGAAPDLSQTRTGGVEDGRLTVVRVAREGAPFAELVVFGAHPTILGKDNRKISGDWPGRFTATGKHGFRLFLQGASGDQQTEGPAAATPERFAAALAARVDALVPGAPDPAPAIAYAAVEVRLPAPSIGAVHPWLRRAARTFAQGAMPPTARVEAVRIGEAVLVAVPAEPVAAVGAGWRAALPAGTEVVSLSGGYLGYVEVPARVVKGEGETIRTYFGPDLALRLGEGAWVAADAVTRPRAAARAP